MNEMTEETLFTPARPLFEPKRDYTPFAREELCGERPDAFEETIFTPAKIIGD